MVLQRRYLSKDREGNVLEGVDGMFRRVARNLSQADLLYGADEQQRQVTEDRFYQSMRRLELLPNSPTLMNAGRELQQLSACFVLPVEDSLDGIFNKVKQTALIHKSGGGTGFAFSRLRPEGDVVGSTGGVASGPVSFIRAFDTATDVVKQGGTRRGANMGILDVTHPDIIKFIKSKEDGQTLINFNISVGVNSDFMEKVKRNESYSLVNPRTGKATEQLNARDVFELLAEMAWKTGDPGLVFLDVINRDNPNPQLGRIESTNPCFAGGVRLATDRGLLTFGELYADAANISVLTDNRAGALRAFDPGVESGGGAAVAARPDTGVTLREAVPVFKTRTDWPVFRLETEYGFEIVATEDHKFFTPEGLKELRELEAGDEILIQSGRGVWSQDISLPAFLPEDRPKSLDEPGLDEPGLAPLPGTWSQELGELLGWVTSEGWAGREIAKGRDAPNSMVGLAFGSDEKKALAPRFRSFIKERLGMDGSAIERNGALTLYYEPALCHFLEHLGVGEGNGLNDGLNKEAPSSIWKAPREAVLGFLSALFTSIGTLDAPDQDGSCSVRLVSRFGELLRQAQLLLLNEGIVGKLHVSGEQFELALEGQSRDAFLSEIGFLVPSMQDKAMACRETGQRESGQNPFTDRVRSITFHGSTDVYCTTEPETHSIVANGLVAAQCGEQPLLPHESCNLASINLARMVRFAEGDVSVDWERLAETVQAAVHMLDNVIDMNEYPIPEIEEMSRKTRRIGLGVMGFADLLVQLAVPYDSRDALEIAEQVMGFIRDCTHDASTELALKRGPFPAWEGSIYNGRDGGDVRMMRNSAPTTIAPTGTISIIAGVSSGIEPLFALGYVRNVMDNTRLVEGNPYFEAVARHEGFYSEQLIEDIARTGTLEGLDVPQWVKEVFRTSHDISPEWHVRMQGAAQAHTDNAVSKTINFPHTATVDDVARAYMLAYELGCKGITVYRDGSKDGQVLITGDTGQDRKEDARASQELAPPAAQAAPRSRPQAIHGVTERVRTGHGNMYVTINFDENNRPFEVFGNLGKAGGCDSAQLEAISRLVSLALRSGIDPSAVLEQLRGITCCPAWDDGTLVRSGPDAVALALERQTYGTGDRKGRPDRAIQMAFAPEVAHLSSDRGLGNGNEREGEPLQLAGRRCPDCNTPVIYQEGCLMCVSCGWNKCE